MKKHIVSLLISINKGKRAMTTPIVNVTVENRLSLKEDVLYIINNFYRSKDASKLMLDHEDPAQEAIVYSTGINWCQWGTFKNTSGATLRKFKNDFWKAPERLSKWHLVNDFLLDNKWISVTVERRIWLADYVTNTMASANIGPTEIMADGKGKTSLLMPNGETWFLEAPQAMPFDDVRNYIINNKDADVYIRAPFKW